MTKKDLNIAASITPTDSPNVSVGLKEAAKAKLKELIAEESRMVKGIFQCFETPGATVNICVKKYPMNMGVQPFTKLMTDGMIYEIPLYVARHLNGIDASAGALGDPSTRNTNIGTCSYPVHGFQWKEGQPMPGCTADSKGVPVPLIGIARRVKRYGFQSMEFAGAI